MGSQEILKLMDHVGHYKRLCEFTITHDEFPNVLRACNSFITVNDHQRILEYANKYSSEQEIPFILKSKGAGLALYPKGGGAMLYSFSGFLHESGFLDHILQAIETTGVFTKSCNIEDVTKNYELMVAYDRHYLSQAQADAITREIFNNPTIEYSKIIRSGNGFKISKDEEKLLLNQGIDTTYCGKDRYDHSWSRFLEENYDYLEEYVRAMMENDLDRKYTTNKNTNVFSKIFEKTKDKDLELEF